MPEKPQRTRVISRSLNKLTGIQKVEPRAATRKELSLVHSQAHLADLFKEGGDIAYFRAISGCNEATITQNSETSILHSAGSVLKVVDMAIKGEIKRAFLNIRPPGHHAKCARTSGFCFVNNVALGAVYAYSKLRRRVLVIDWDIHHGDGTQEIIQKKENIYYISIHEKGIFPESDKDIKTDNIHNFSLGDKSTDTQVYTLFLEKICPLINKINPAMILISCGFDGHSEDSISSARWTTDLYGGMTRMVVESAPRTPIVSVLEGGYNLDIIGACAETHCRALLGE